MTPTLLSRAVLALMLFATMACTKKNSATEASEEDYANYMAVSATDSESDLSDDCKAQLKEVATNAGCYRDLENKLGNCLDTLKSIMQALKANPPSSPPTSCREQRLSKIACASSLTGISLGDCQTTIEDALKPPVGCDRQLLREGISALDESCQPKKRL